MSYDRQWLLNREVIKNSKKLLAYNLINSNQFSDVIVQFPDKFYSPNIFIRTGLYVFTFILALAAFGIAGSVLFSIVSDELYFGFILLAGSVILILALERIIKQKKHFQSGIDDCLLMMAVIFAIAGIIVGLEVDDPLQIAIVCLPFLIFSSWRYFDSLMSLLSFICLYVMIFLFAILSEQLTLFLPFIFCILSMALAFTFHKMLRNDNFELWKGNLKVLKIAALLCIYFSVNYFVVKEGNAALNNDKVYSQPSPERTALQDKIDFNQNQIDKHYSGEGATLSEAELDILQNINMKLYEEMNMQFGKEQLKLREAPLPFESWFLLLTFLLPFIYIGLGLQNKDRILLNCGVVTMFLTVITMHYHFDLLSTEQLMCITGFILVIFSWYIINYLKSHASRFTFEPEKNISDRGFNNVEAIASTEVSVKQVVPVSEDVKFGGGQFGGGGAGGKYG